MKSLDKSNRERYNTNVKYPQKIPSNKDDKNYINEAVLYVENNFPNNYGNTDNFIYPVTHKTAKKWFNNFIKNKLNTFRSISGFY